MALDFGVAKAVADKLKIYLDIHRREEAFELTDPVRPLRKSPILKPRSVLSMKSPITTPGLVNIPAKEVALKKEIKEIFSNLSLSENELSAKRQIQALMSRRVTPALLSANIFPRVRDGVPEKRASSAGTARKSLRLSSQEQALLAKPAFPHRQSLPEQLRSRDGQRLLGLTSKLLVATETSVTSPAARSLRRIPSAHSDPGPSRSLQKRVASASFSGYFRDTKWAHSKGMGCFLSVGQGSEHESKFLELVYRGAEMSPVVLVGKGVTFDSGGISIKPSAGMAAMKGDMGGAACVLAALEAASRLSLPVHLVGLMPLVENMPSGSATNPGDVFTAMNGKSVEVDNTDAEGRLILADALCYAEEFKPQAIINLATLTGAMDVALGGGATGCFTTCSNLWSTLHQSGQATGDRVWRMPLYKHYTKEMECSNTADLRNTQKKARSAGSATAAAFLKEFVKTRRWAHLDIAGVMDNAADASYLSEGMTGRPTRTLIEAVRRLSEKS